MGQRTVSEVVSFLKNAGIRCQRGFPGYRMPDIQKPAVSVNIHSQDATSICMAVWVFSRADEGAMLCEDTALRVARLLRGVGAQCRQEAVTHDGRADRFAIRILVTWTDDPEPPPFSVSMEGMYLPCAVRFTAVRNTELRQMMTIGQSNPAELLPTQQNWICTLEELFPPEYREPIEQPEPVGLVVQRATLGEYYVNCFWKSIRREDTPQGLRQIRVAVAQARSIKYG